MKPENIIPIPAGEDLLTLTRVIADLQSQVTALKVQNDELRNDADKYRKYWLEDAAEVAKLRELAELVEAKSVIKKGDAS